MAEADLMLSRVCGADADPTWDVDWVCFASPDTHTEFYLENVPQPQSQIPYREPTELEIPQPQTSTPNVTIAAQIPDPKPTNSSVVVEAPQVPSKRGSKRKAVQVDSQGQKKKTDWRKYGQKTLTGRESGLLRCYYRCNRENCKVKKQVVMASFLHEPINVTMYGVHNHPIEVEHNTPLEVRCMDRSASEAEQLQRTNHGTNSNIPPPENHDDKSAAVAHPIPPLDHNFVDLVVSAQPHFVIADPNALDCPLIFASAQFLALTGYSSSETVGRNCRFLQGPATNIDAIRQLSKAVKSCEEVHVILLNYKKNQKPFWNLLRMNTIRAKDGTVHSIMGAQLDITSLITNGPQKNT